MSPDPHPPLGIDVTHPSPARAYDYLLGGKDNYAVDRAAAEAMLARYPDLGRGARVQRAWMIRVVRFLAGEAGVRQFLDVGSGLPTAENVHQVAQRMAPGSRVMYVDNDPIVLAHGRALLAENGHTGYAEGDVRDAEIILEQAAKLLDFSQPVAVIIGAVLHYCAGDVADVTGRYVAALAHGSYLAISHNTPEGSPPELIAEVRAQFPSGLHPRPIAEIEAMFHGAEFVEPGLVDIERWRPGAEDPEPLRPRIIGGVARI